MKIESKEKLAKLLAVEDLDVQHQQVETAYFDIKNRCLILPIWKEMMEKNNVVSESDRFGRREVLINK